MFGSLSSLWHFAQSIRADVMVEPRGRLPLVLVVTLEAVAVELSSMLIDMAAETVVVQAEVRPGKVDSFLFGSKRLLNPRGVVTVAAIERRVLAGQHNRWWHDRSP